MLELVSRLRPFCGRTMIKLPPFDPADLKPIRDLHKAGKLGPMGLRRVLWLCSQGQFPCVKLSNVWHSTEAAVRHYVWLHATPSFKSTTT
jgi:hypothetical protein